MRLTLGSTLMKSFPRAAFLNEYTNLPSALPSAPIRDAEKTTSNTNPITKNSPEPQDMALPCTTFLR